MNSLDHDLRAKRLAARKAERLSGAAAAEIAGRLNRDAVELGIRRHPPGRLYWQRLLTRRGY